MSEIDINSPTEWTIREELTEREMQILDVCSRLPHGGMKDICRMHDNDGNVREAIVWVWWDKEKDKGRRAFFALDNGDYLGDLPC